jgi:LysM repeat protein
MGMQFESDQQEEELTQYDAYTALDDRKGGRKAVYFGVAAGLGLLILALAFVMLGNGSDRQATAERLNLIEKRVEDMEFRLANLIQSTSAGSDAGALQKADEDLGRRLDTLEKKLEGRLNQINTSLAQIAKQQSTPSPKTPAAPVQKPAAPSKIRLHTVQKGETLYQISRQYGMSVDALRKLNGIGKDFKIFPGQKIKVAGKP